MENLRLVTDQKRAKRHNYDNAIQHTLNIGDSTPANLLMLSNHLYTYHLLSFDETERSLFLVHAIAVSFVRSILRQFLSIHHQHSEGSLLYVSSVRIRLHLSLIKSSIIQSVKVRIPRESYPGSGPIHRTTMSRKLPQHRPAPCIVPFMRTSMLKLLVRDHLFGI
jgi:hypothetical protein